MPINKQYLLGRLHRDANFVQTNQLSVLYAKIDNFLDTNYKGSNIPIELDVSEFDVDILNLAVYTYTSLGCGWNCKWENVHDEGGIKDLGKKMYFW